jgi:hypothetical protein
MQMVVHHVGPGHVVRDHREAAASVGLGLPLDVEPVRQRLGRRRFRIDRLHGCRNFDRSRQPPDLQLHLHRCGRVRDDIDLLLRRIEALGGNRYDVASRRYRQKQRFPLRVGFRCLGPGGRLRLDGDVGGLHRQALRVERRDADATEQLRMSRLRDEHQGNRRENRAPTRYR